MLGVKDSEALEFLRVSKAKLLDLLSLPDLSKYKESVKKAVGENISCPQEKFEDFLSRAVSALGYICLQSHLYESHGNLICENCILNIGKLESIKEFMAEVDVVLTVARLYIFKYMNNKD